MKVGDLIRLRLPYMEYDEIAMIVKDIGLTRPDPTDRWWAVLLDGQLTNIHQDYIREVLNEGR